jgi:hypothetical protein
MESGRGARGRWTEERDGSSLDLVPFLGSAWNVPHPPKTGWPNSAARPKADLQSEGM